MKTTPVNYDLPTVVADALQTERVNGPSMRKTVCAAVHWYLHRLNPALREQARSEANEWVETGMVPPATTRSPEEQADFQAGVDLVDAAEESAAADATRRKSERQAGGAS